MADGEAEMSIVEAIATEPDAEQPIARARRLAPLVERYADASEAGGTLAPDIVEAFRDADLFWMLVPCEMGGLDLDVIEALELWEEVSRADASAGWSLMANALGTGIAASFLSDEAVRQMFGGDRKPIMAGMAGPGGSAVPENGGYRGGGKYQFGSGCVHADWFLAGMFVSEQGENRKLPSGGPEVQVCFLPRDQVETKGNWHVFGLAGTGSIDYEVKNRWIAPGFSLERGDTTPLRGSGTFDLGIAGMGMAGHAAVALGLAKRALEEVAVIAARRKRPHYKTTLSDHPVFRHDYALQEASYLAARAFTFQVFRDAQQAARSGGLTPLQSARMRQAVVYVHNIASDVVRFCHVQGGSDALRNPSVLGRCMRDMHAATQHVFVDTTYLVDVAGSVLDARRAELDQR